MKAILVIELDDEWLDRINTSCDEMLADVTLYKKESLENQCDYSQRIFRCWCTLKPLPPRKEFDNQIPYEKSGWNDCLDEILGEEE